MNARKFADRLSNTKSCLMDVRFLTDLATIRLYFRLGMVTRRKRDTNGSPYLTTGHGEAAYTKRTNEMVEILGSDIAALLQEARIDLVTYLTSPGADPIIAHFAGAAPRKVGHIERL